MEQKEDIGKILKDKFEKVEKSPEAGLWNRIENSLDRKDRKRRGFFFLWMAGGTGAILLLLLLVSKGKTNDKTISHPEKKIELVTLNSDSLSDLSEIKDDQTISYQDFEIPGDSLKQVLEKTADSILNSEGSSLKEIREVQPFRWDSSDLGVGSETGEYISVKTTYQYYNSETDQLIETTDKKLIDSLLNAATENIDSLALRERRKVFTKSNDSL